MQFKKAQGAKVVIFFLHITVISSPQIAMGLSTRSHELLPLQG